MSERADLATVSGALVPLSVREATLDDRDAIQRLCEEVFSTTRSAAQWDWHFNRTPAGPAVIHLLEADGAVVGHHAHSPFDVWIERTKARLALSHELMIDSAYRGQGGTGMLARAFIGTGGFDVRIGFPYDHAARLLEQEGVGYRIGALRRWVRVLPRAESGLTLRRLPRGLAQMFGAVVGRFQREFVLEVIDDPGSEFDDLASRSAGFARCIRVRDAAYLRWRWFEEAQTQAVLMAARDRMGQLRGYVVVDTAVEEGFTFGRVLDILAIDLPSMRALLLGATRVLAEGGVERIECFYQDPRRWSRLALVSAGFLPAGAAANVFCGTFNESVGTAPLSLRSWFLTQGDSDFDAAAAQPDT